MPLTAREKEILRPIAAGEADLEIADSLCISKDTVQSHVANMKQKTGASSRGQLVALALREGLLENGSEA